LTISRAELPWPKRWGDTGREAAPLLLLTLLVLWEVLVKMFQVESWLLPAPTAIGAALVKDWPTLISHSGITIYEALIGFALSVVLAFVLATLMDCWPLLRRALYPLLVTSQTIPIISVAPLFLIWFGYGLMPKVLVVVLVCFFPVAVSFLQGLTVVDPEVIDLLRSMGASKLLIFRLAKLPAALPTFFSGLKIAATYSIMGAVIGEWLGAEAGLGYYMTLSQRSFLTARLFAIIVIITILSLALFKAIELLERVLTPWTRWQEES
jgi:ABC-type nitrate/sulfonate/bicarbonate transport system permease component